MDSDVITDNFEEVRSNSEFPLADVFFPGQKLRGRMKHLQGADFTYADNGDIKRAKHRKVVNVVVLDVEPVSLNVQWQWQTPGSGNPDGTATIELKTPNDNLTGEEIKKVKCLNLFESCTVQISDVSYYTPSQKDVVLDKGDWNKKVSVTLRNGTSNNPAMEMHGGANTKKKDDDEYEDEVEGPATMDSTSLPISDSGNTEVNIQEPEKAANPTTNKTKVLPKVSTRSLRKKKLKKAVRKPSMPKIGNGDAVTVVETLHTQSVVDIVWQVSI